MAVDRDAGAGSPRDGGHEVRAIPFRAKSELVYETLRRAILSGELQPGQRVDQQRLASQLAVSRMPLRQALLRLADDGFLTVEPHRSAFVASLSERDMAEVYDMRTALESMLAAKAACRGTPEAAAELDDLVAAQQAAISSGEMRGFVELDRAFHRAFYELSEYAFACETVERLRDRSDRYIHFYASHGHGAEQSIEDHRRLVEAFRAKDSRLAHTLTQDHIERGRRAVAALMGGAETDRERAARRETG